MPELPLTIAEAAEWPERQDHLGGLTEAQLARAHATQDTLAAFILIMDEVALAGRAQADADFAAGVDKGPLQGIPIGVKDIIATKDAPRRRTAACSIPPGASATTPRSSRSSRAAPSSSASSACTSSRSAGPIRDTGFRIPKNPWELARDARRLSSGPARPSAAASSWAARPARRLGRGGLVLRDQRDQADVRAGQGGVRPLGYSLDHIGPMARPPATARSCSR